MLLVIDPGYPQPRKLQKAVDLLKAGMLVCYPTDTGYGIGCDPHQHRAVEALVGLWPFRSEKKPGSLLACDFKQISRYCYIGDQAFRVAKRTMPGPYTLILEATKEVPRTLHGKRKEVGIRIPDHPIALGLLELMGSPILNITAQDHRGEYLDDPHAIDSIFEGKLAAVIDCDIVPENPSTVIDLTGPQPEVLRVGAGDPDVFL